MDLSEIKPSAHVLDILHPGTGEETGLKIELVSMDDERVKKVQRKWQNAALQRTKRNKKITAEEVEARSNEILAAAMVGIVYGKDANGKEATWKGEQPKLTAKLKDEMLSVEWLRRQIDEALGDSEAFFAN